MKILVSMDKTALRMLSGLYKELGMSLNKLSKGSTLKPQMGSPFVFTAPLQYTTNIKKICDTFSVQVADVMESLGEPVDNVLTVGLVKKIPFDYTAESAKGMLMHYIGGVTAGEYDIDVVITAIICGNKDDVAYSVNVVVEPAHA